MALTNNGIVEREVKIFKELAMSVDGVDKQWDCRARSENLQGVSSIGCNMEGTCLHPSPIKVLVATMAPKYNSVFTNEVQRRSRKVNKMLNLEKWQTVFDSDGKLFRFRKALKLIVLGGVDPSIRPEVWEFLLGCYTLISTREYRKLLRAARRERYEELVKQCQKMHSSRGTMSLAYVVGSKIMDVRTYSKDDGKGEVGSEERNNSCTDTTYTPQRESSSDSSDIVSLRQSIDIAAYDTSCLMATPAKFDCTSPKSKYPLDDYFDFPPLPVRDLFERSEGEGENHSRDDGQCTQWKSRINEENMCSTQSRENEGCIVESNGSQFDNCRHSVSSEIEMGNGPCEETHEQILRRDIQKYQHNVLNRLRISDVPEVAELYASNGPRGKPNEDNVSEWLWTLHRIVVDVIRTDSYMEFYEDPNNLARMSDTLVVYAWVDPETGYCQC